VARPSFLTTPINTEKELGRGPDTVFITCGEEKEIPVPVMY